MEFNAFQNYTKSIDICQSVKFVFWSVNSAKCITSIQFSITNQWAIKVSKIKDDFIINIPWVPNVIVDVKVCNGFQITRTIVFQRIVEKDKYQRPIDKKLDYFLISQSNEMKKVQSTSFVKQSHCRSRMSSYGKYVTLMLCNEPKTCLPSWPLSLYSLSR